MGTHPHAPTLGYTHTHTHMRAHISLTKILSARRASVRACVRARARVYIDAPVLHAVRVPADRLTTVVVRDSASAALTEVRCETVVNCAGARGRLSGRLQAKLTRQKTGGATCADGVGTPADC